MDSSLTPVRLAAPLAEASWLDRPAGALQHGVGRVVPAGSARKDALSGTWLGHALHPMLTDIVVGAWTSALLLDLAGGQQAQPAADALVAAGVLAALPTAASGLADWADTQGRARRIGAVHAAGNAVALVLNGLSLGARRRGDRTAARALSGAGFGAAAFSAWLGGHLSYAEGVGVNQTAFDRPPGGWTPVLPATSLPDGRLTGALAGPLELLLLRRGDAVLALHDRCSHRGCLLSSGRLDGDVVECPCHGSRFRLDDGSVARGPATSPQPVLEARITGSVVEVRQPGGG